ncbi:hypothetical protein [Methanoregula sp.]|uniref:hypothetical protein n=1 Tax=Methanoregula sp. TaxID=2052170 RepID=UPI00356473F4
MTLTRISEVLHEWTGWCPNRAAQSHPQVLQDKLKTLSGQQKPHSPRAEKTGSLEKYPVPGWFVSVSIIVLFGTLFFGGSIYWPLLVLAILIAGLAYWYFLVVRRAE